MAGTALTDNFLIQTATVMLGLSADLMDLDPVTHSMGLVKNFTISSEPSLTELTQGLTNNVVDSVVTGNPVRASMEVYEYTSKNLSYSLGLAGSAAVAAQTVSNSTASATTANSTTLPLTLATGFAAGDYIMIKMNSDDNVITRRIVSIATNTLTLDKAIVPIVPISTPVTKVNMIQGGSTASPGYFSCKVVGKLTNGEPIVLLLPKVRIVKGFALAFSTENYGNLPIELSIYDQVATDPFYAQFSGAQYHILARK